ncbi:MAG: hypothetical protein VB934_13375 [Polyangiaceae bacterium]
MKFVSSAFVLLSIASLSFFVHKVLWLVRYKKLQRMLMEDADVAMRGSEDTVLPAWEAACGDCWRAQDAQGAKSADALAKDFDDYVERTLTWVKRSTRSITTRLLQSLDGPVDPPTFTVLEAPDPEGKVVRADVTLDPEPISEPEAPADSLFELSLKSRYSWLKRALVFCAGIADVVYSSQHIATMSQYTHVPTGVIVRRLSLVVLLVVGMVAEVAFGLRAALEPVIAKHLVPHIPLFDKLPAHWQNQVPSVIALIGWTLGLATLYLTLFLWMRRQSHQNITLLKTLREDRETRLAAIRETHLDELREWSQDYGGTLDAAVELTARHIRMLGEHYMQRLRQRFADRLLLDEAEWISAALFSQLPEAEGKLQDKVTTQRHSWRHALWPRTEEMDFVIRLAQYRRAWQHIELTVNELRRGTPDVTEINEFWCDLAVYASIHAEALPEDTTSRLHAAYRALAERCHNLAARDQDAFSRASTEMIVNLDEQLTAAAPLLSARIELANQRITADAARYQAEIIRARERARLEAMAFEI